MDGVHDLGGKQGFGAVTPDADPRPFPTHWEGAVFAMIRSLYAHGVTRNTDQFRHAIERIDPRSYLSDGYYGRWLGAAETLLVEAGVMTQAQIDERARALGAAVDDRVAARPAPAPDVFAAGDTSDEVTAVRNSKHPPRLQPGDTVRTAAHGKAGHTRLPAYARGRQGVVTAHHGAWVYPDSNAHGLGEDPQHLYTVRFDGTELWGPQAEPASSVTLDLFEPYLEKL